MTGAPEYWRIERRSEWRIRVEAPDGEAWSFEDTSDSGGSTQFVYRLLTAMLEGKPTPDDVTREMAEALREVSAAIQVDGNTGQFVLARSFDATTVDAALASYESKYGSKA